ncbi:hypothetical protein MNBD_GAMMA08-631 [hydrothermal vent metagenome]|uniref:Transmembrane protein n=1 Tax=hydrothermal vent metagenome TaxID=652676 RepID=A0A3B0X3A3_9ZZZZ
MHFIKIRGVQVIAGLLICLSSGHLSAAIAQYQTEEERLFKAAFIYNFAKFTSWPKSYQNKNNKLTLCTLGKNELTNDLKRLGGKTVKGRQVVIKEIEKKYPVENCQMLYIANVGKNNYINVIKKLKHKPVLTISDLNGFAKKGGVIQFYRKQGKTRLIINLNVARQAGLKISSRLLILANVINSRQEVK